MTLGGTIAIPVTVLAVMFTSGCTVSGHGAAAPDRPVSPTHAVSSAASSPPAPARVACASSDVHLGVRFNGAAGGTASDVVAVTDTSGRACWLRGFAQISFSRMGKAIAIAVVHQNT